MTCIVQKFGGTSVATVDLIKKAALKVKVETDAGNQVVVVVSAMAGVTNSLIGYVRELSSTYDRAEYDAVVSAGEQITAGLLALALQNLGIPARSWFGWQVPIITDANYSKATIENVEIEAMRASLKAGMVAVVSGFQGISPEGRITTLGRGGSDTTAVALTAALKADRCDIFTDVEGVYTADPRYVSDAEKLDKIAYAEMLELASQGAKVLQRDSVELAMKHKINLRVLSSLSEASGTLVVNDYEFTHTRRQISGVACNANEAQICLVFPKQPIQIFDAVQNVLNAHKITIDMVEHSFLPNGKQVACSFTINGAELERAKGLLLSQQNELEFENMQINNEVSKISIVGWGLQQRNISNKLFHILFLEDIQILAVQTSDIKLSVLIDRKYINKAVKTIHDAYGLNNKG